MFLEYSDDNIRRAILGAVHVNYTCKVSLMYLTYILVHFFTYSIHVNGTGVPKDEALPEKNVYYYLQAF